MTPCRRERGGVRQTHFAVELAQSLGERTVGCGESRSAGDGDRGSLGFARQVTAPHPGTAAGNQADFRAPSNH